MKLAQRWMSLVLLLVLVACGSNIGQNTEPVRPDDSASIPNPTPRSTQPTDNKVGMAATSVPMPTQPMALSTQAPSIAQESAAGAAAPLGDVAREPLFAPPPLDVVPTQPPAVPPIDPNTDGVGDDSMYFKNFGVNPFVRTTTDNLSTFAMDVDTASYSLMRSYINGGQLPDPDSVRVEEYLNSFNYQYPAPETGDFSIYTEAGPSPFGGDGYELVQIGIQGRQVEVGARKPAALTFVIDISGSMARGDRLDTVKQALTLLVDEMKDDDTIAIAVYGSEARAVLDVTSASRKDEIIAAINALQSEGSTNVQAGLRVGFGLADEAYKPDGINMIILCSDGVANSGVTSPESLLDEYKSFLDQGIQLSTYGFGMGNFNDILMERLADGGDGTYAYIDSLDQAKRLFVQNLTGTLQTIARDAKIQVEFDPTVVDHYRLVGYENRDVADADFRNDAVDAGEVGAGHSVTALYEIKRVSGVDGKIATVHIRYQPADGGDVIETSSDLTTAAVRSAIDGTTPRFKLAAAVAFYAELLRHSQWTRSQSLESVVDLARVASAGLPNDADVAEFVQLISQALDMAPR